MSAGGQKPVFGLPSSHGRGRGRGRGRGAGPGGRRLQQLPLGGGDDTGDADGLGTLFPQRGPEDAQDRHASNVALQNENVREADEIDAKLGFERYQEGPPRLGWLVNMHATSVADPEHGSTRSAVDYYFLEQDGGLFKCTLLYKPYFYVVCVAGSEPDVEEWMVRKFDRVDSVETVQREDLRMANHLTGGKRQQVKLVFRNVQDLLAVRRELQPMVRRNERRSGIVSAYEGENTAREVEDMLLELREYDVPYYLRVAIDMGIRVGHWYDARADAGEISLARREDLVQRADPVVLAFDIETTKLPLKFPDATTDMVMMISYMIDGQGYLITNREVVAEDIEDFEYTPTAEFPGPFTVFNEPDEEAVIRRFLEHIHSARPTVLATYNGDSFDWPFIETRARHHGIDIGAEVGWHRDESDEYKCRSCVHMDCLRWVKRDSYLPVGSQGLKAVTTAKLGYNPMEIDPEDMTRFAAEQPQTLAQYSVSDAVATYYLYMKYVHPFIFSLCNIIPLNPDDVLRKGSGTLCETLLMVEAHAANVAIPNKHVDPPERSWDGHLIETETYVGGHVEALEAGVFRSDIPMRFRIAPEGVQQLLDELDRALRFSIEVEGKAQMDDVENYAEVRSQIAARLEDLRDRPVRSEEPLLYHLDVAAMYPNIILTNRLQPDAIVDESVCASCDFNVPGKTCDRSMPWLWRGEYFPPKRSEIAMLRRKLEGETFAPYSNGGGNGGSNGGGDYGGSRGGGNDGRGAIGKMRTFDQLSAADQAQELRRRVADYSRKVYHRLRETKVEERQALVCQRENPFYVDTVRNFRDRRYVYKGLLKKEKRKLDDAVVQGDSALVAAGKKLVVVYDSLQLAHKCILNSFYGYVMRKGARWHSLEMAGVVCLTGSRIIQMARLRVEQLGRPLELDTDGIWCALPRTFPENYTFQLSGGRKLGISYPCTMLNHLVFDQFTNHQYQDLVDPATLEYRVHAENSIFFEVDGPYRAMILPSSKEEDKLLKKRYAVFNDDGSLAELKGFEVKRRGELKLIKIFQSQIFKVFLEGGTLDECYGAVARVANQWLDILFSRGRGLPDDELFDLITENRSMSKALESYGGQKSTSICTARRLAEFLGDQMVRDKGLACKFVISRQPQDLPVSERAVPVAIFAADAPTRRQFLRRWLRDSALEDAGIREILDWDYYLERFGSVIQKLITIPAAMQGVSNPVPRIRHPDWLARRVSAAANAHKQRHITDAFRKVSREEYLQKAEAEDARVRSETRDMEDLGAPSAAGGPRAAVCRRGARGKRGTVLPAEPDTAAAATARIAALGPAPDPSVAYGTWLAHTKQVWRLRLQLRVLRERALERGEAPTEDAGVGIGQFFGRTQTLLARTTWHIIQWTETETPGELRAWAWVGGQMHAVRVAVPRVLYVASAVANKELAGSAHFAEAPGMVLPRTAQMPQALRLYRCAMPEAEYTTHRGSWGSFFAHPSIAGVYETEVEPLDRALIQLGATAWLSAAARRRGVGAVVSLDDLDTWRTAAAAAAVAATRPGDAPGWGASDMGYALLYHAGAPDGRQFFGLVLPAAARAQVWVVSPGQQAAQLQIPNLERLYRESRAAAAAATAEATAVDDAGGAFAYPDALEVGAQAYSTAQAAYRAVNAALAQCADERKGPMVLVCHSALPAKRLRARVRAIGDFPTVAAPIHQADRALPALDWQRHACRRLVACLLGCSQWVAERIALAQYADIPLGNIPADAPLFLADVFFARKLALAKHVLWWSPSSRPDLGGRQDDEPGLGASDTDNALLETSAAGSHATVCAEIELRGLAVATVLKAPLVNEIEGAFGVFGFDGAGGGSSRDTAALLDDDGDGDGTHAAAAAALDTAGSGKKAGVHGVTATTTDGTSRAVALWAAAGSGGVPVSTFQLLRGLLRGWWQEAEERQNPFAAMMTDHFYRWLTRPSALLHDPALATLVRSLMRKVFLQLQAECRRLGARIVYASQDRLIVASGRASLAAAQASIAYLTKAIVEKPLFENIVLAPQQLWTFLLWMDAANYGGVVAHGDEGAEPRIEMLWGIKDHLPPAVQSQFELTVAEFIYKLASFHGQQHAQNPHAAAGADAGTRSEAIDDVPSDAEEAGGKGAASGKGAATAAAGRFYRRLIGQYFTRKLLATVPEIRASCSGTSAAALFPRLPGAQARRDDVALEFIKHVTTVFALDVPATNFVRVLRRNLLTLVEVGEFAREAQFVNPCARLVLPRVVCDFCNFCRDMDFCRDADLLPAQGAELPADWACLGCGCAYDRTRIEERLVEQLHEQLLAYQMQDLVCVKCRLMKQDNFSLQCTGCAGKYRPTIDPAAVREQVRVYLDVAALNGLAMLHDLAQWAQDHAPGAASSARAQAQSLLRA
ncbi:DNA polymerase epsilon catalytic subunit [Coemansia biformis]|uniref:DNA polymerase epsilon catalytic subunit n=1 Tax=Coemansia biformis TaxID=1286918 RepID=A0A9W8CXC0_9FUNG|nr:DNA polymerase epsilon catalytic subunit [Coemansia biformis]